MINNELQKFREAAGRKGISKADLARKLGVNRSYITRLENGDVTPSLEMAYRIADCLNCQVTDLFRLDREAVKKFV